MRDKDRRLRPPALLTAANSGDGLRHAALPLGGSGGPRGLSEEASYAVESLLFLAAAVAARTTAARARASRPPHWRACAGPRPVPHRRGLRDRSSLGCVHRPRPAA